MATNQPIKRLELEFIPSNISGYDSIIRLNIVKSLGFVGPLYLVDLDKYIVDESETEAITDQAHLLQYIGNGVYMSEDIFLGGVDIAAISKDKSNLSIGQINLKDFRYLLDVSINPTDLLVYSLSYQYEGEEYTTPVVMSYRPIDSKPLFTGFIRPCVTLQNHRFKGPNESDKFDQFGQEQYDDLNYLNGIKDDMVTNIQTNTNAMDNMTSSLYNISDQIAYYQKYILGA